ncbi:MAG: ABC transporter substrate-binding protein, partial [Candidatus Entotheonellia bacterium]
MHSEMAISTGPNVSTGPKWKELLVVPTAVLAMLAVAAMSVVEPHAVCAGAPSAAQTSAKPTGDLRIAMAGIGIMRPIPWQETAFGKGYLTLLFDFLVGANPDGSLSAKNGAAEKWEVSPDGKTWTFSLRKGIKFHDGTELTAQDAKWSLEMVTRPESVAGFAARLRGTIQEIAVTNPYTLVIRTKEPSIFLPQDLSLASGHEGAILPRAYYEKVGADGFAAKAMGSGPYTWAKGQAGTLIQLEAMDRHWAEGIPKFK